MNIFQLPDKLPVEELFETLWKNEKLVIERIISTGQQSAPGFWYRQEKHEWVILLQGEATLSYEDKTIKNLTAGDYLYIPAGLAHRVEKTSQNPPCIWLAVHFNN
ncbi:MAG: cupin domain-containing protein [Syntrophomonadaceae bacterium]|nr:cupin domain-containing protein [Syntrophomonadaceae bacterium]